MAETKRARSTSNSPEPDAKRANIDAEAKKTSGKEKTGSKEMASNDNADLKRTEEKDAVDLGPADSAEDSGISADPKRDNSDGAGPSNGAGADGSADGADGRGSQSADNSELQPTQIAMRALIVTGDASIIIGKQGKHINEIRDKSGARLNISESIPGNPERIMTVTGPLDAVSKAFGLIVRRINDEPFDSPSVPGSRAVTIRFVVPNSRMGSVIGKQGSKIKEIQEASGARLTAGEAMLPGSTERVLSISGVADAVHIAVYYVGTILLEHQDRNANNMSYRPSAGPSRGAMAGAAGGYPPAGGFSYPGQAPVQGAGPYGPGAPQLPPGSQTQQIFIPNDLVGCIIGKGGQKINEIRQMSASHIKIMEPGAGIAAGGSGSERLVTITGPPPNIQMAVSLLYQRLEQEKMRLAQGGAP
ncbi:eukaryotic type KH-domain (KH-domain type I) [Violaceomyces palustris]|uniref:Eukaryotic type KH-domain (KH-domain type I) n=1 Tax=Violaceomyces palustris TaxID=1673888 RepID=A0ACD0P5P2_9BASI|nr:eukaryotic type KH-domain (KH-domain type I) [Violaceomyces palustris]